MLMDRFGMPVFFFDKDGGGGSGAGEDEGDDPPEGDPTDEGGDEPQSFDDWIEDQDESVQSLIKDHTSGLKSALDSEREQRKDLQDELRELAADAEKGSEAEKKLNEMADELEEADRRADFYEAAHEAGVTNLKLGYLGATEEGLFDRRGTVNFETMRTEFPELFEKKSKPKGNAGDGTGNDTPGGKKNMNEFIRKSAGR